MWWDEGARRTRLSWISGQWPVALSAAGRKEAASGSYSALDPNADYILRTTGNGDCFPCVNDVRLEPTVYGKEIGDIKEFPVPKKLYPDGVITLTFDPVLEPGLNWRVQSRLTEVWLIKKK
jgi:hypothetical protein